MKKIVLFVACLLPIAVMAQTPQPFNVTGKLGNLNAKLFLAYQLGSNKILDSAVCVNGNFEFKGDLIYPVPALLIVDSKNVGPTKLDVQSSDRIIFYLDKGTIKMQSPDSAYKADIIGSPINDQYIKLMTIENDATMRTNKLMTDELKAANAQTGAGETHSDMQAKLKVIQTDYRNALRGFVKANPDSYLSLLTLGKIGGPSPDPNEILPLLDGLSKEIRETETARVLRDQLEKLKTIAIGVEAPDFEQADTLGHPVRLSSFRGKYVLLDFWASWCGPCRQESPNLVKAYNDFKGKNFTILSVSLDRPNGTFAWLNAIRSDHLNWTHVSDLKFWNNAVAQLYLVQSIPQNFLIDPSGKIIAQDLRGNELQDKLTELLGKSN